jgi:DNA-binding PadR family transcriptional regulator
MNHLLPSNLVAGWETLQLAAVHRDGQVRSLLRLNKQLAYLQREGFPIPIQFTNIEMGPASSEVKRRASAAEQKGLLVLQKTPVEGLKDREEFHLTDEGRAYVKREVMPALHDHPRGKLYIEVFADVLPRIQFRKNTELVEDIHRSLYLDDPEQFFEAYVSAKKRLDDWRTKLEDWRPREKADLTAGAAIELGSMALEAIADAVASETDQSTGKNNLLWNCERLVELLEIHQALDGKARAPAKAMTHSFDRILNALEVNAGVYGVLHIPTDEEIRQSLEAGPFDPDEVTF